MERKAIKKEIKEKFLSKEKHGLVITVKGKWGSGKTYFIKNLLDEEREKYAYISLFGKNSINEITQEIVLKISKFRKILGDVSLILKQLGGLFTHIGAVGNLLSLVSTADIKGSVVVVDDFERLSENLHPREVMGLVAQLKEDKQCKVILIMNEEVLTSNNEKYKKLKEEYDEYKEKIVDLELVFEPSVEENFEIACSFNKENFAKEEIESYIKEIGEINIRLINYLFVNMELFSFLKNLKEEVRTNSLKMSVLSSIIKSLLYYLYIKHKNNTLIWELEAEAVRLSKDLTNTEKKENVKSKIEKIQKILKDSEAYKPRDFINLREKKFGKYLLKIVKTGVSGDISAEEAVESIKAYLDEINEKFENENNLKELRSQLENIHFNFTYNIYYTKEKFKEDLLKFLEEHKEKIFYLDMDLIIFLLDELIKLFPYKKEEIENVFYEIFTTIIKAKLRENPFFIFDFEIDMYLPQIKKSTYLSEKELTEFLEDLQKIVLEEQRKILDCTKFMEYLAFIINKRGWEYYEIDLINSIQKNELIKCLKESKSLKVVADFARIYSKNSVFTTFKKNLIDALEEIKKDFNEDSLEIKRIQKFIDFLKQS